MGYRVKVLLLENSRLYLVFLTRLFKELGFEPVTADDLPSARRYLADGGFSLVCMNMYLRGCSAFEFVRDIRALAKHVPVLMLTANKAPPKRSQAMSAGITEVIYKSSIPEMADRIGDFVRKHLKTHQAEGRILYVEDSKTETAVISKFLKSMGMEVDHHNTAEAALEQFIAADYDLVISDLLLKGEKSGLSLVESIRHLNEQKARIPVLTVTSYDDVARRIELLRAGTNDYIVKPVVKEELKLRVTNLITNKKLVDRVIEQQAQLYELAITDQLTGCHNRRGFREFADKFFSDVRAEGQPVSLLMIDLDHFKLINDNHGHDVGDKVLYAVGTYLNDVCRQGDAVCRLGGEEFIVMLTDCDRARAMRVAKRMRKQVEALNPEELTVTASIGVTTIPGELDSANFELAMSVADQAVYRAKNRGRNRVSFKSLGSR
ncbi:MAG: PleD family two-component system response regulator [Lysobacteraceae bacterium]|nr:MAG: PleD family two-component system response regulator [Xanthomonadaceae bacterium]